MTSETTPLPLNLLLPEAMKMIGAVAKKQRNAQQGFNFRGIDAIVNATSPVFRELGLFVYPVAVAVERGTAPTKGGGTMNLVWVLVTYRFCGPAGDCIDVEVAAESFDAGDKATAKAMSVALRIALLQTLLLPTDDPDPDSVSYERAAPEPLEKPLTPLQWVKNQGAARFIDWNRNQQNEAYKAATEALAIERVTSLDQAEMIIEHMANAYKSWKEEQTHDDLEPTDGYGG